MNICENCKNSVKVSEEKIYCKLKAVFKWQDDECKEHRTKETSNN